MTRVRGKHTAFALDEAKATQTLETERGGGVEGLAGRSGELIYRGELRIELGCCSYIEVEESGEGEGSTGEVEGKLA